MKKFNLLLIVMLFVFSIAGISHADQPKRSSSAEKMAAKSLTKQELAKLEFPIFLGNTNSQNTIIFYINPQCPSAKTMWPHIVQLRSLLSSDAHKIVITGTGFDSGGTTALFVAAILAEQNQEMAMSYLTAVHNSKNIKPFDKPRAWVLDWVERSKYRVVFDKKRFDLFYGDKNDEKGFQAYMKGEKAIKKAYSVKTTPTTIINHQKYTGTRKAQDMNQAIMNSAPYANLP